MYIEQPAPMTSAQLARLREAILASPHLGASRLSARFARTLGFSVVFTRSGLPQVRAAFPSFADYLATVVTPAANAFYLNPLVLTAGARVGAHIDTSLSSRCGTRVSPIVVSVLYVHVPDDMRGGELVLRTRRQRVGEITPSTGLLVAFQGDLVHAVRRVLSVSPRVSLVCEQYALEQAQLQRIPAFSVTS